MHFRACGELMLESSGLGVHGRMSVEGRCGGHTPGGVVTQSGSATKLILSSVGGLVEGVREGTTEHRRSDPAAVQGPSGWWPHGGLT